MIKIRYSDLQPGLHASAETEGKHTVVYLVPGLSPRDRQSAIDRLRASAKVGHGPKLPAVPLALALIADRIAVNSRNAVAAARLRPTSLAIPAVVLAGAGVLYGLLVTVSIHMGLPATSALTLEPLPVASAPAGPGPGPSHQASAGGSHSAGPAQASRLPGSTGPVAAGPTGPIAPGSGPHHQATPSPSSSQSPTGPSPPPSPSPTSTWTLSPSPRPSPSKTRSGGGGGGGRNCLNLGLIHLCV